MNTIFNLKKSRIKRNAEMAEQLRALANLAEDWWSGPGIYI